MEKMMFEFLDEYYPDVYRYKLHYTLFPVISGNKREQIKTLCSFFSCEFDYGVEVYEKWLSNRPIYTYIENSTNGDVLVAEIK